MTDGTTVDLNTTLCLACSSSLPPQRALWDQLFFTECCARPICPTCLKSNPRLSRYNPCLACLGGIGLVASSSTNAGRHVGRTNIDGSVQDEDTFVLGEDSDDETARSPPPVYESEIDPWKGTESVPRQPVDLHRAREQPPTGPRKYYLERTDTLQGLALRFKVDPYQLCKLNNLPTAAARTAPHLLHTRAFIFLPEDTQPHPSLNLSPEEERDRETKIVRERAGRQLQKLTKEQDINIVRAYIALAEDEDEQDAHNMKNKELGSSDRLDVAAVAVTRYLDDAEWAAGRSTCS